MGSAEQTRDASIIEQLRRHEFPKEWRAELEGADGDTVLLMFWLDRLSRRVEAAHLREIRNEGLSRSEAMLLYHLLLGGPPYQQSPTRINANLDLTSGGITKAVDRLEAQQLVERRPDQSDRRSIQVGLTKEGRATAQRVARAFSARYAQLVGPLDKRSRRETVRTLRMLLDAFDEPL